jgi:cytidine deaminase
MNTNMMRTVRIVKPHLKEIAKKKAEQGTLNYRVSAVGLNRKGEVIGSACNTPRFFKYGGGNHAEMNLLEKCKSKPHTIILCRIGNGGDVLPIKPCERCQKILDKYNIKVKTVE